MMCIHRENIMPLVKRKAGSLFKTKQKINSPYCMPQWYPGDMKHYCAHFQHFISCRKNDSMYVTWVGKSHHLISEQQDCLQAELAGAKIEEILQARPQQLHDHHIVITFCPTPLDCWNAHCKKIGVNALTRKVGTPKCGLGKTERECVLLAEDSNPLKQARDQAGCSSIRDGLRDPVWNGPYAKFWDFLHQEKLYKLSKILLTTHF